MIKFYSKKKSIDLFRKRAHLQLQPGTARWVLQHPKHPHFLCPWSLCETSEFLVLEITCNQGLLHCPAYYGDGTQLLPRPLPSPFVSYILIG